MGDSRLHYSFQPGYSQMDPTYARHMGFLYWIPVVVRVFNLHKKLGKRAIIQFYACDGVYNRGHLIKKQFDVYVSNYADYDPSSCCDL